MEEEKESMGQIANGLGDLKISLEINRQWDIIEVF